jgi:hypothetical protein
VWVLLDLLGDILWWWPSKVIKAYRSEQRRARQRERVFCATQASLARQNADEARVRNNDYFVERPGKSSLGG